jgi:tripartite-type tricarboxylate transporter receptor subunit TctC
MRTARLGFLSLIVLLAGAISGMAQSVEEFYKGRPVNLIVGFNPGGGYDVYARIMARYLPKHIPGTPNIIVKHMPGAGSLIAANHLYNVAPRDGSELGMIAPSTAGEPIFGLQRAKFDGRRFSWIGSAYNDLQACVAWHGSQFRTMKDLFEKEMLVGASGSSNLQFPLAMNMVLGTKMKPVRGYKGSSGILLALERGEVQGFCGTVYSILSSTRPDWIPDKKVRILVNIAANRPAQTGDIPFIMDYAKTDEDRHVLALIFGWNIVGRSLLGPPGLPDDRKAALRTAFNATMKDPAFLAEAKQQRVDISPVAASEIDEFMERAYKTPSKIVARAAQIMDAAR